MVQNFGFFHLGFMMVIGNNVLCYASNELLLSLCTGSTVSGVL